MRHRSTHAALLTLAMLLFSCAPAECLALCSTRMPGCSMRNGVAGSSASPHKAALSGNTMAMPAGHCGPARNVKPTVGSQGCQAALAGFCGGADCGPDLRAATVAQVNSTGSAVSWLPIAPLTSFRFPEARDLSRVRWLVPFGASVTSLEALRTTLLRI